MDHAATRLYSQAGSVSAWHPENLDVDALVESYGQRVAEGVLWLGSCIYTQLADDARCRDTGQVCLKAEYLRSILGRHNLDAMRQAAAQSGYIERDPSYQAGVRSQAYRILPPYDRGRLARREIRDLGLCHNVRLSPVPGALPVDTPLFDVPDKLVRILDRDLVAAGIARKLKGTDGRVRIDKRDERGRTVDVHALRHTFGTLLGKGGVKPRTAQAAMRHSKIDLTMNVYTDPKLLDIAGAVEALPSLPLGTGKTEGMSQGILAATGTDDVSRPAGGRAGARPSQFAPKFAPTTDKTRTGYRSTADKMADNRGESEKAETVAVSAYPVNRKSPLTTVVNGLLEVGDTGLEPVTPSLSS